MKLLLSLRKSIMTVTTAMALGSIFLVSALAQARNHEHKPTLRAIMQELGAEYLRLANALITEDFKEAEQSAKAIQGHPLPDEIAAAIKNKLGRKFAAFERADESSHRSAAELAKRAAAKDASGSGRAFAGVTNGCISCHRQFRTTLKPLSD